MQVRVVEQTWSAVLPPAVGARAVETEGLRGLTKYTADLRPGEQMEVEIGGRIPGVGEATPSAALVLVQPVGGQARVLWPCCIDLRL